MNHSLEIEKAAFDTIAQAIHSDKSPVGIDAKKTHVLILHLLEKIDKRLDKIEEELKVVSSRL